MESALPSLLSATLTVFIALVFARAVLHKASAFTEFTGFVADYRLLPDALVRPASAGLIGAELLAVATQLIPGAQVYGLALAAALFALYATAMGTNILRGRTQIECGCGGAVQPLGWSLVVRNAVLVGFTVVAAFSGPPELDAAGTVIAIVSGLAVWAVFLLADQILANSSLARLTR